ncbi:potassium-transporting ATPase subunit KdpA [Accumulibacter sp.]|uniref:potassium-transporting ATPase subunit KdpA n=1 Tax=Accumulibacter sp. TaxID=2053492 RepID=UPI00262F8DEA|nr:potassium-transporting ATPase subunit KdpA [Accumulibacter sp.]
MNSHAWLLLGLYMTVLLLVVRPLGLHIARVMTMDDQATPVSGFEGAVFRVCGIRRNAEMGWLNYALAVLLFNALGLVAVYALQRLQFWLPLNPQEMANVSPGSAFNTAVSFVTNTNWQGYDGESTMSYLVQMLGLTVQNFLSAATGIAVAIALVRGFARHSASGIGNAWVDLFRVTVWILLPLSLLFALFLASQGVLQNFAAYQEVTTLEATRHGNAKLDTDGRPLEDDPGHAVAEPATAPTQTLPMGPVASQVAIKMLGTNGGGFFNANSAHPFENPTPLVNFLQMLSIFLIPGALCLAFGRLVGDERQGWTLFAAMALLFVAFAMAAIVFEQQGNPRLAQIRVGETASVSTTALTDGNMEGKETRFGIADSALFATITTAASCGAVNAMHDSFTPLGGAVPLVLMQLGEVVFGGVGSGLYGMLVFAVLAVFIAGLMIGRTPEYLGKKIEAHEMKMTCLAILATPLLVLIGTAIAVMTEAGRAGIANPGAHGFSEVLYALSSAANNNGSAFAGLSANTPFYNGLLTVAMCFGRFAVIIPVLAMAGSLAAKQRVAVTAGTLPTHGPLFVALLIGVVLLVGLLNYVPALALGPLAEHLALWSAR